MKVNIKKKHHAIFDSNQMKIISDKKYLEVNNKVHTPLSSIFSLQSQKLKKNDTYKYNIYNLGKLKEVNISVLEKEKIKTPFGSYQSIVVSPKSIDGTHAISNKGDMKIWFSDDEKQIPLKIEIKIKHGSISLLLESIEQ